MRRLKAQLMGMFSGKSDLPLDSSYLPDSATNGSPGAGALTLFLPLSPKGDANAPRAPGGHHLVVYTRVQA